MTMSQAESRPGEQPGNHPPLKTGHPDLRGKPGQELLDRFCIQGNLRTLLPGGDPRMAVSPCFTFVIPDTPHAVDPEGHPLPTKGDTPQRSPPRIQRPDLQSSLWPTRGIIGRLRNAPLESLNRLPRGSPRPGQSPGSARYPGPAGKNPGSQQMKSLSLPPCVGA